MMADQCTSPIRPTATQRGSSLVLAGDVTEHGTREIARARVGASREIYASGVSVSP
jgi:hypothetical protein